MLQPALPTPRLLLVLVLFLTAVSWSCSGHDVVGGGANGGGPTNAALADDKANGDTLEDSSSFVHSTSCSKTTTQEEQLRALRVSKVSLEAEVQELKTAKETAEARVIDQATSLEECQQENEKLKEKLKT